MKLMMSKVSCKLMKKLKGVFVVKVDAMLVAPPSKIQESLITPLKENVQKEMLKILTVKWVRS